MSYTDGIKAMTGRSSSTVEGFFTSKDEVRWYVNQTNSDIESFAVDVAAWAAVSGNVEDKTAAKNYMTFKNRWAAFYPEALGSVWRSDAIQQIDQWRQRLIGWRRIFMARGMKPVTADPEIPRRKEPWVHSILIGATAALLGGLLTEKFVRRNRK